MDWSKFTRKIRIDARPQRIYNAWTKCSEITQWFLATCINQNEKEKDIIHRGDEVIWTWHNYPNESNITFLITDSPSQITFTFGHGMEVDVFIKEEGPFSVLTLTQRNIPTDDSGKENFHIGCRQAWSTWLLNLKIYLEHDITVHDKDLGEREDLFDFVNT